MNISVSGHVHARGDGGGILMLVLPPPRHRLVSGSERQLLGDDGISSPRLDRATFAGVSVASDDSILGRLEYFHEWKEMYVLTSNANAV